MFGIGRKKFTEESWREYKLEKMAAAIGPAYKDALHYALPPTPHAMGLSVRPQADGRYILSTADMSPLPGEGPSNEAWDNYELLIMGSAKLEVTESGKPIIEAGHPLLHHRYMLTMIVDYAHQAVLNPGNTIEFPEHEDDPLSGTKLLLQPVDFQDKLFGLMTIVEVHASEVDYAGRYGSEELSRKLTASGYAPFTKWPRPSVI